LLLSSVTDVPPVGAAEVSVIVPVDEFPPVTAVGLRVSDASAAEGGELAAAFTVRVAVRVMPPYAAEIVEEVLALTLLVETVKVALVAPAGTLTFEGTVAAFVLLLESVTDTPPEGAAESSVTVPIDGSPPVTVLGLRPSDDRAAGSGSAGGGGWVVAPASNLVTKASPQKIEGSPAKVRSKAPWVVGKSAENVLPTT
jgi:hypothetical protein